MQVVKNTPATAAYLESRDRIDEYLIHLIDNLFNGDGGTIEIKIYNRPSVKVLIPGVNGNFTPRRNENESLE